MSNYHITKYSYDKAKQLGVKIKPSKNPAKKIDVYKNDERIASIGAVGYQDYPNWIKTKGLEFANQRRKLYRIRHKNDANKKGTPGFYANKILW